MRVLGLPPGTRGHTIPGRDVGYMPQVTTEIVEEMKLIFYYENYESINTLESINNQYPIISHVPPGFSFTWRLHYVGDNVLLWYIA